MSVSRAKGQKSTLPCQKGVPDKRPEGNPSILQTKRHSSFPQPGAVTVTALASALSQQITYLLVLVSRPEVTLHDIDQVSG